MSILQEYEQIRKSLRPGEFEAMELFLELHPKYDLSDIYYNIEVNKEFHTWWDKIKEAKAVKEMLRRIEKEYQLEDGELDRFALEEEEEKHPCGDCAEYPDCKRDNTTCPYAEGSHQAQGICPECGCEDLGYCYEDILVEPEEIGYGWTCTECGATGQEWSSVTFIEHRNVEKEDE